MTRNQRVRLSVKDLRTYFFLSTGTVRAVDGVNLDILGNEVIALVGESGCGKTVTALSIMGLVPDPPGKTVSGEILFENQNLLGLSDKEMQEIRGKRIAMIFQDPLTFLNPVMKIGNQIGEVLLRHGYATKKDVRDQASKTLEWVGMPSPNEILDHYPHQLSGGMRQRVMIAMAISCGSSILIADEPTTALDVTIQMQILTLLKNIVKTQSSSLLLITHDLGIVADISNRVYVMYAGEVVEYADVFSIYDHPKHPYTQGLLISALSIDEFKKELQTIEGYVPDMIKPPSGCRFHPRCKYVKPICRERRPPTVKEGDSEVACWLYA